MTVLAPLYPNHLLRALPPNTSTLGVSPYNSEGDTNIQSVQMSYYSYYQKEGDGHSSAHSD